MLSMANTDNPSGLRPIRHKSGIDWSACVRKYYVPATYETALFLNEPVVKTGTSNTALVRSGKEDHKIATLPEVNKTAAGDGNASTGVIVGFEPDVDGLRARQHRLADTERVALVCDDPHVIYEVQDDGAAASAATTVGLNAVFIDTHAGDTITGIAGTELDMNSDPPDADASNQMTILRLADIQGNAVGANAVWEVHINNHTEAIGVVGL